MRRLEWTSTILYAFYNLPLHVVVINKYYQIIQNKSMVCLVFYSHAQNLHFFLILWAFLTFFNDFGLHSPQENRLRPKIVHAHPENQISTCSTFSGGASLKQHQKIIPMFWEQGVEGSNPLATDHSKPWVLGGIRNVPFLGIRTLIYRDCILILCATKSKIFKSGSGQIPIAPGNTESVRFIHK